LFFFEQYLFAQNSNEQQATPSIFEKHQKSTLFLNHKLNEIDSIVKQSNSFFVAEKQEVPFQVALDSLLNELRRSFTEFTNFNSKRIIEIDQELTGIKPIKGSDIAYLHHSFQVYQTYFSTYSAVQKRIKFYAKKPYKIDFSSSVLRIKLDQMNFFYKNYYSVIKNTRIRRVLNASDASFAIRDNDFRKNTSVILKRKNYKSVQKLIKDNIVSNYKSPLYNEIKNSTYSKSRIKKDRRKTKNYFKKDVTYQITSFFTHYLSAAIGNAAGAVRVRKGYLFKNDSLRKLIKTKLHPMDILAEKTGFALTDKMIPGHFGHIALWLGTEEQLKQEGLWDDPIIKPFQNRIRHGNCVLESARDGTHLKTLEDFINVDELAIARIKGYMNFEASDKIALYQNAFAQLGKDYDFNFDVETSGKLVCSELLYQVFGSIYWPTDKFLQRSTISPDNVLSLALYQNSPIELVYFIEAKNKHTFCTKSLDQLAVNLGFEKRNNRYVLPDEKCQKKIISKSNTPQKKCEKVYHELIYQN